MNYEINKQHLKNTLLAGVRQDKFKYLLFPIILCILVSEIALARQNIYSSAEEAANHLYEAIEQKNTVAVEKLLGTEYIHLLPLEEVDEQDRQAFIAGWKKSHQLLANVKNQYFIEVGLSGWTFPIPVIKGADGWYFDTQTGIDEMRIRRIGKNELSAMQAALAYYDAQLEYAGRDRNGNGTLEYAQQFISTEGKKDGLYWPVKSGEIPSPLGILFANKTPDKAYYGYYYKILKAQGHDADGGAYSYMLDNKMQSGFALIAWPAEYGQSGIMSFMISHHGVLYEKNLGPDSTLRVEQIQTFNPDSSWVKSEESL